MRWITSVAGLAGLIGMMASGCGGGPGGEAFVGTYQVSSHRYNSAAGTTVACNDPGQEIVGGDPYIALIVDPFFDDPDFIRLQSCTAIGACTDELVLLSPGGPGLQTESANTQIGGGVTCGLYAGRETAALSGAADEVVTVEVRNWYQATDLPESQCTLGRAEALRSTPDCRDVEVWVATRVSP